MVSGQFQFGFSNVTSLLIAQERGLPLKVVSNGVASTGKDKADYSGVVTRDDSIKTAADLEAGRVDAIWVVEPFLSAAVGAGATSPPTTSTPPPTSPWPSTSPPSSSSRTTPTRSRGSPRR